MKVIRFTALLLVFVTLPVFAVTPQQMEADKKVIAGKLLKTNPSYKISDFKSSELEGFYKVQLESGPLLYMSKTGEHFFEGSLYTIKNNVLVNLTDQDATLDRAALMKELNPAEMIIFSPKAPVKKKATITVYTDVDCGYCQKLHQEVPELNAHGVEVRYLAYPRAGIGSPTYKKLVSAWCAINKQEAITQLKNRQSIPELTCNNPVEKQYNLGRRMGINGTPAILLEDGRLIPGYKPAPDLVKFLGI
jgi:thiol:disulfide interchange protein DsbC